mmetsp:Transcript_16761/g.30070  ORF Transcript_16761/g.30070 Transcript_16761/m.30070 type:complete len:114 (-) Transcript_16761:872-1213(-)
MHSYSLRCTIYIRYSTDYEQVLIFFMIYTASKYNLAIVTSFTITANSVFDIIFVVIVRPGRVFWILIFSCTIFPSSDAAKLYFFVFSNNFLTPTIQNTFSSICCIEQRGFIWH